MRVSFKDSGGFDNIKDMLKKATRPLSVKAMSRLGDEGVEALRAATPRGDTGQTANGWEYRIERKKNIIDLYFVNNAHPNEAVNIAKILDLGHGTKNGGYVQPRNYIRPAIAPIFNKASEILLREVLR